MTADGGIRALRHKERKVDKYKEVFLKIGLGLLALLLSLFLVEIGFRVKAYRDDATSEWAWGRMEEVNRLPQYERVGLWQMSRINRNPRIIYELIPNLSVTFRDAPVRTDRRGFRITQGATDIPPTCTTLVGIGDSVMFGWGVAGEETYLARLAEKMSQAHPGGPWRVINTAVPGYNTVMEVETLKEKGLALSPDIVLLHFVRNDLNLPNFIRVRTNVFDVRRSFLREYFSRDRRFRHRGFDRMVHVPFDPEKGYVIDKDKIPPEYRGIVGESAFTAALRELHALSQAHAFETLVLCDMDAPSFLREICDELDFRLIETGEAVYARLRETGSANLVDAELVLSAEDSHPSVKGHELIADVICNALRGTGRLITE